MGSSGSADTVGKGCGKTSANGAGRGGVSFPHGYDDDDDDSSHSSDSFGPTCSGGFLWQIRRGTKRLCDQLNELVNQLEIEQAFRRTWCTCGNAGSCKCCTQLATFKAQHLANRLVKGGDGGKGHGKGCGK